MGIFPIPEGDDDYEWNKLDTIILSCIVLFIVGVLVYAIVR